MGYGRKARRQAKRRMAGVVSNEQAERMIEAGEAMLKANVCTAEKMLTEAQPKMEADIRAHYDRHIERIKADLTAQAEAQVEKFRQQALKETQEYEDKCRREYDERVKIPKAKLKREVMGDIMMMVMWVLQDKMDFDLEQMHRFLHQLFLLEADMQEPKLGLTINDLVLQMKREGYDINEDIELIDELVEAEHERFTELQGQPYVPRGSIKDKWRTGEEERMKRLLCEGVNYLTIGVILGRSEGACKARARKLWGTIDPERIKKVAA